MSLNDDRSPHPRATPEQLKGAIDAGRTGDKTPGYDPGAAPLGSDAEAGGAPLTQSLAGEDGRQERTGAPTPRHPNAATGELQPDGRLGRQTYVGPALIGVAAGAAVAALLAAFL